MDYLNSESEQEALILMMDAEHEFALGETVELHFRTKGSLSGQVVPGTRISVKMISTVVEPATLAQGETNAEGDLRLSVDIPALRRGSSALIVTATQRHRYRRDQATAVGGGVPEQTPSHLTRERV